MLVAVKQTVFSDSSTLDWDRIPDLYSQSWHAIPRREQPPKPEIH